MDYNDEHLNQRATEVFMKVGGYAAASIGLILLSFIVPLIHDSDWTDPLQGLFLKYGVLLFAYVAAIVFCFVAARRFIFNLNKIGQWVYLPLVAIFFAYEAYQMFMEFKNDGN